MYTPRLYLALYNEILSNYDYISLCGCIKGIRSVYTTIVAVTGRKCYICIIFQGTFLCIMPNLLADGNIMQESHHNNYVVYIYAHHNNTLLHLLHAYPHTHTLLIASKSARPVLLNFIGNEVQQD